MIRIITLLALLILKTLAAQHTSDTDLKDALNLWNQNQQDKAMVQFEKMAEIDSENWLVHYYVAYSNITKALKLNDNSETMKAYIERAQEAQDKANLLQDDNAEVLVVQALINTGWIVFNPMLNGQKYSNIVQNIYKRAIQLAPENPRVVLCKAEFEMGLARYFGGDVKQYCEEFKKAKELFTTFKPESDMHPNWGLDRVAEGLVECNQ